MMAAASNQSAREYARLLAEVRAWLMRFFAARLPVGYLEDAVQETLFAVHMRRSSYDAGRPFLPWLIGIASRKHVDHLRQMTRRAEVELSVDLQDAGNEEAVTGGIDLAKLLTALKPAQQEVIHLVKIRGLSIEEASMKTGQSVSLVKINIHRGLMKAVMTARDDPTLAAAK